MTEEHAGYEVTPIKPKYMSLPPKLPEFCPFLPKGTRIRFIKELSQGPTCDTPGCLFAPKNGKGTVVRHGCYEGHWVTWDNWDEPFGAECGVDFVELFEGDE